MTAHALTRCGRAAVIGLAIAALMTLALAHDRPPALVWNASASLPIGLYRVRTTDALAVGDLVAVRPPAPLARFLADRGYVPAGVPLMKHVAALSGQIVCRTGRRIVIDGIAAAEARERDRRDRPLPAWHGCRHLAAGEVFLLNAAPDSLDGRYFGSLPRASILGRATPLWTIGG